MSTQFAFIYLYVYTFSCHFDNYHNNIMTIICHQDVIKSWPNLFVLTTVFLSVSHELWLQGDLL